MDPLEQAIEELKKELGEDVITTGSTTPRSEKAIIREAFDDFNERNPLAGGGMLVQPSTDGSRPGYATSKTKTNKFKYKITNQHGTFYSDKKPKSSARKVGSGKFSKGELNRVTRIKYPEIGKYEKLNSTQKANVRANLQYASVAGTKVKKKTPFTPLTTIQQNKILAEFPSADFSKGKFGFNAELDQTRYQQVKRFIDRGYKPKFKKIPEKLQEDIKQKFSYFKDWDFDKYKYGVPSSGQNLGVRVNRENNILAQRVKTFISDPKPYKLAFPTQAKGGWMLQQMYRSWEHGNTNYEPIYNKNDKVIGMKENGKVYYANENVAPSNKAKLILAHPEFNKVQKFVDVANEAKLPLKDLTGYKNTKSLLALFPEGYEKIKFTDLVSYLYKEQGVDATRNAIEKHHLKALSDMGAPVDSKNLQLLRKDLNTLGNTITQQIKEGDLSRVSDLEKAGVKITVDGKTYGKGFQDPRRQFNRIIGDVTEKISSLDKQQKDNFFKFFKNKKYGKIADVLVKAGKDGGLGNVMQVYCARKKAKGGRIFLSEGSGCPAARQDPEQFLKDISKDKNVARFFNSTAGKKAATAAARVGLNVINPSTLIGGEVAYVLADGLNNFSKGMDLAESFDRAFVFADFKQFDEAIINKAKELKFDDNQLKVLQETMNINRLDNEIGKLDAQDRIAEADKSLETPFANTQVRDKVNKQLDQSVDNYLSTLRGMGFKFDNVSDYDTGFNYLDNVFKKKTQDELVKTYQARARQVDPTSGKLGNVLDPLFDLGAYTQPLKYAADIVNPFTKNVPFKSERQREADRLREMEGRELYLYNKQRGFDLDSITDGTSPYISEVMQQLGGAPTGEGMFASFAGGGIAGLSGGIDEGPQRISMNPDSQGLSGLLKNGKKI